MTKNLFFEFWDDEIVFAPNPMPYGSLPRGGRILSCGTPTKEASLNRILDVLSHRMVNMMLDEQPGWCVSGPLLIQYERRRP